MRWLGIRIDLVFLFSVFRLVFVKIDQAFAEDAARRILNDTGGNCMALAGDSSNTIFIQQMIDTAVPKFGQLDIVLASDSQPLPLLK